MEGFMSDLYINRYKDNDVRLVAVVSTPEQGEAVQLAYYRNDTGGADYFIETKPGRFDVALSVPLAPIILANTYDGLFRVSFPKGVRVLCRDYTVEEPPLDRIKKDSDGYEYVETELDELVD
jgi:hypothetical protein